MAHLRKVFSHRLIAQFQVSSMPLSVLRKFSSHSTDLKEIMAKKIYEHRKVVKEFREKYGSKVIEEITVDQMYGGMRGMKCLLTETSELDPEEGIRIRNRTLPECLEQLPKAQAGEQPLPEGLFWLLMTGDMPTYEQTKNLSQQWADQAQLPPHVLTILNNFPPNLHPVARFTAAITACNTESVFAKAYSEGVPESRYWEFTFDDAMSLIAKLPTIAATIYRNMNHQGSTVCVVDPAKDWAHNFASMLGNEDHKFIEFMRLYLTILRFLIGKSAIAMVMLPLPEDFCISSPIMTPRTHKITLRDHEGGNVSAHTAHLVGSALSDPFLSFAAGMSSFAGPLHGLAVQEVLAWIAKLMERYGPDVTEDQMKDFVWETLNSGQVVPGYGHAVLRRTDPRFTVQHRFALKHLSNEPLIKIVSNAYKVVPQVLREYGKVKNPWPNSDACTGALFQCLGLKDMQFSTLVFGVSRALGVMASLVWDRALSLPMEQPSSLTTDELKKIAGAAQNTSQNVKQAI